RDARPGRAPGAARHRAARPLPDLQRGIHGHGRHRPDRAGADRRGDPAHPPAAPAAARRRRGHRPARAHAADRRPPDRPDRPRRTAGPGPDGGLIPLGEQDRSLWDSARIAEGVALVSAVLPAGQVGPYQVQAAIAAVHDEARSIDTTDWPQILGLYELLEQLAPGPIVSLNRAVAVAMVAGPAAGLDLLRELESHRRLAGHHRLHAARAPPPELSPHA